MLACIQRFLSNYRLSKNHGELGELIVDEITEAEIKIIKTMKQKEFTEEYKCLKFARELSTSNKIVPLILRTDENVLIGSGDRLENADCLSFSVKNPIILDNKVYCKLLS